MNDAALDRLLQEVRACRICESHLPHGVRPVLRASSTATILVAGQAPGRRVHESGGPFDDPSGDRLREWMGIDAATFYDTRRIAIIPMGFCYPGTGKSGDLAPHPECADTWRTRRRACKTRWHRSHSAANPAHSQSRTGNSSQSRSPGTPRSVDIRRIPRSAP